MDTINTSIDTNSVDKKKKLFLPKLLIALSSLFSIVGVGLAILPIHYKSARAVSYDDEEYSITLSADELNNYTFENFLTLLSESDETFNNIADDFEYNNTSLQYDGGSLSSENYYFTYSYDEGDESYYIDFNYFYEYKFAIYTYDDEPSTFLYDIVISGQSFYDTYKSAIELDIAANQPYTNNTFLEDIIELLVGGIGVTASGIGSGLSVLVSNITIQNGAMSPFMAIVLIFGGIALALALSRWVVNLIGSLGQRNR